MYVCMYVCIYIAVLMNKTWSTAVIDNKYTSWDGEGTSRLSIHYIELIGLMMKTN